MVILSKLGTRQYLALQYDNANNIQYKKEKLKRSSTPSSIIPKPPSPPSPSPSLHLSHPSSFNPSTLLPHTSSVFPHPSTLLTHLSFLITYLSSLAPHGLIPHTLSLTPRPSSRIAREQITHDKFCKIMEKNKFRLSLAKNFWIGISLQSGIRFRIQKFRIRHTGSNPGEHIRHQTRPCSQSNSEH